VGDLVRVLRQRGVVVLARRVGIKPQVELVLPAELEAGAAGSSEHGVIDMIAAEASVVFARKAASI
jgi:hypothetical protein